jgi:hypothetical protein
MKIYVLVFSFFVSFSFLSCELDGEFLQLPKPQPKPKAEYEGITSISIAGFADLDLRGLEGQVILQYKVADAEDMQEITYEDDGLHEFPDGIDIYSITGAGFPDIDISEDPNPAAHSLGLSVGKLSYYYYEPYRDQCDITKIVVTEEAIAEAPEGITIKYCATADVEWDLDSLKVWIDEGNDFSDKLTSTTFPDADVQNFSDGIAIYETTGASRFEIVTEAGTKVLTFLPSSSP